jgi:hypothetical protein
VGTYDIVVDRKNGADGQVSIAYKTTDINAIAGKDYLSKNHKSFLVFKSSIPNLNKQAFFSFLKAPVVF